MDEMCSVCRRLQSYGGSLYTCSICGTSPHNYYTRLARHNNQRTPCPPVTCFPPCPPAATYRHTAATDDGDCSRQRGRHVEVVEQLERCLRCGKDCRIYCYVDIIQSGPSSCQPSGSTSCDQPCRFVLCTQCYLDQRQVRPDEEDRDARNRKQKCQPSGNRHRHSDVDADDSAVHQKCNCKACSGHQSRQSSLAECTDRRQVDCRSGSPGHGKHQPSYHSAGSAENNSQNGQERKSISDVENNKTYENRENKKQTKNSENSLSKSKQQNSFNEAASRDNEAGRKKQRDVDRTHVSETGNSNEKMRHDNHTDRDADRDRDSFCEEESRSQSCVESDPCWVVESCPHSQCHSSCTQLESETELFCCHGTHENLDKRSEHETRGRNVKKEAENLGRGQNVKQQQASQPSPAAAAAAAPAKDTADVNRKSVSSKREEEKTELGEQKSEKVIGRHESVRSDTETNLDSQEIGKGKRKSVSKKDEAKSKTGKKGKNDAAAGDKEKQNNSQKDCAESGTQTSDVAIVEETESERQNDAGNNNGMHNNGEDSCVTSKDDVICDKGRQTYSMRCEKEVSCQHEEEVIWNCNRKSAGVGESDPGKGSNEGSQPADNGSGSNVNADSQALEENVIRSSSADTKCSWINRSVAHSEVECVWNEVYSRRLNNVKSAEHSHSEWKRTIAAGCRTGSGTELEKEQATDCIDDSCECGNCEKCERKRSSDPVCTSTNCSAGADSSELYFNNSFYSNVSSRYDVNRGRNNSRTWQHQQYHHQQQQRRRQWQQPRCCPRPFLPVPNCQCELLCVSAHWNKYQQQQEEEEEEEEEDNCLPQLAPAPTVCQVERPQTPPCEAVHTLQVQQKPPPVPKPPVECVPVQYESPQSPKPTKPRPTPAPEPVQPPRRETVQPPAPVAPEPVQPPRRDTAQPQQELPRVNPPSSRKYNSSPDISVSPCTPIMQTQPPPVDAVDKATSIETSRDSRRAQQDPSIPIIAIVPASPVNSSTQQPQQVKQQQTLVDKPTTATTTTTTAQTQTSSDDVTGNSARSPYRTSMTVELNRPDAASAGRRTLVDRTTSTVDAAAYKPETEESRYRTSTNVELERPVTSRCPRTVPGRSITDDKAASKPDDSTRQPERTPETPEYVSTSTQNPSSPLVAIVLPPASSPEDTPGEQEKASQTPDNVDRSRVMTSTVKVEFSNRPTQNTYSQPDPSVLSGTFEELEQRGQRNSVNGVLDKEKSSPRTSVNVERKSVMTSTATLQSSTPTNCQRCPSGTLPLTTPRCPTPRSSKTVFDSGNEVKTSTSPAAGQTKNVDIVEASRTAASALKERAATAAVEEKWTSTEPTTRPVVTAVDKQDQQQQQTTEVPNATQPRPSQPSESFEEIFSSPELASLDPLAQKSPLAAAQTNQPSKSPVTTDTRIINSPWVTDSQEQSQQETASKTDNSSRSAPVVATLKPSYDSSNASLPQITLKATQTLEQTSTPLNPDKSNNKEQWQVVMLEIVQPQRAEVVVTDGVVMSPPHQQQQQQQQQQQHQQHVVTVTLADLETHETFRTSLLNTPDKSTLSTVDPLPQTSTPSQKPATYKTELRTQVQQPEMTSEQENKSESSKDVTPSPNDVKNTYTTTATIQLQQQQQQQQQQMSRDQYVTSAAAQSTGPSPGQQITMTLAELENHLDTHGTILLPPAPLSASNPPSLTTTPSEKQATYKTELKTQIQRSEVTSTQENKPESSKVVTSSLVGPPRQLTMTLAEFEHSLNNSSNEPTATGDRLLDYSVTSQATPGGGGKTNVVEKSAVNRTSVTTGSRPSRIPRPLLALKRISQATKAKDNDESRDSKSGCHVSFDVQTQASRLTGSKMTDADSTSTLYYTPMSSAIQSTVTVSDNDDKQQQRQQQQQQKLVESVKIEYPVGPPTSSPAPDPHNEPTLTPGHDVTTLEPTPNPSPMTSASRMSVGLSATSSTSSTFSQSLWPSTLKPTPGVMKKSSVSQ